MLDLVPDLVEPIRFDPIAGGLSNLTYTVTDSVGRRWVLRRPPLGHVLATAHDMSREFRIINALSSTDVPVAPVVGFCEDETVNGAPFYVMEFVDGIIARDAAAGSELTIAARTNAGRSLIDNLIKIHAVDVDAVGLGDLGRKESYVERQLSRWQRQWEATKDDAIVEMTELHQRLSQAIPQQGHATIVHGDYRLDNCIVDQSGSVVAVLDWELCTLGDPLADLGLMFVSWAQAQQQPLKALRRGQIFWRCTRHSRTGTSAKSVTTLLSATGNWPVFCKVFWFATVQGSWATKPPIPIQERAPCSVLLLRASPHLPAE